MLAWQYATDMRGCALHAYHHILFFLFKQPLYYQLLIRVPNGQPSPDNWVSHQPMYKTHPQTPSKNIAFLLYSRDKKSHMTNWDFIKKQKTITKCPSKIMEVFNRSRQSEWIQVFLKPCLTAERRVSKIATLPARRTELSFLVEQPAAAKLSWRIKIKHEEASVSIKKSNTIAHCCLLCSKVEFLCFLIDIYFCKIYYSINILLTSQKSASRHDFSQGATKPAILSPTTKTWDLPLDSVPDNSDCQVHQSVTLHPSQ